MTSLRTPFVAATLFALSLSACGGSDTATADPTTDSAVSTPATAASDATAAAAAAADASGGAASALRVVSPEDAEATIAAAPEGLVILDVRTPEEFAEGHIDGAVMLDFYRDDFAAELAKLDPDVPYVLYCRSGSRSGQALTMMDALGFTDVEDVDGGIVNWQAAGLPVVAG